MKKYAYDYVGCSVVEDDYVVLDTERGWRWNRDRLLKLLNEAGRDMVRIPYEDLPIFLGGHTRQVVDFINRMFNVSEFDIVHDNWTYIDNLTPPRGKRGGKLTADMAEWKRKHPLRRTH